MVGVVREVLGNNWRMYSLCLGLGGLAAVVDFYYPTPINLGLLVAVLIVGLMALVQRETSFDFFDR